MSVKDLIIEERSRDIGDFLVGRLLPFRKKRMVGPFIFIDHMGPSEVRPGKFLEVDQHPHIGLATITYLLEGEIEHRDSIGSVQRIVPGAVNLMTAGKGVTHTERTPSDLRSRTSSLHGYQIWIALPKEFEEMEPEFQHFASYDLPYWDESGASFRLIVGEGYGKRSPVPVLSKMYMIEIEARESFELDITGNLEGEIGILISEGSVTACDNQVKAGQMLVSKTDSACKMLISGGSRVFLFGGEPFPEKRYIEWNFVSSSKERLQKAKEDWKAKRFPKVPGDDTYVPLPANNK
jgi:redox-sensitive bicupin YhaK (pirin superfamily)